MSKPMDVNELITRLSQLAAYDPDGYDLYAESAGALSHMRARNVELLAVLTDLAREYELWAYHFDNDDSTANARLIAAAPDLLAALKASEREYENLEAGAPVDSGCIECTLGTVPNDLNTGLCAHHLRVDAIAKAEGR